MGATLMKQSEALVGRMVSQTNLDEARSEAQAILNLRDEDVAKIFFEKTMLRNLSRTVHHLDRLVESSGEDHQLGVRALRRLGFPPES